MELKYLYIIILIVLFVLIIVFIIIRRFSNGNYFKYYDETSLLDLEDKLLKDIKALNKDINTNKKGVYMKEKKLLIRALFLEYVPTVMFILNGNGVDLLKDQFLLHKFLIIYMFLNVILVINI